MEIEFPASARHPEPAQKETVPVKRAVGRPVQRAPEETRQLLIDAAAGEFAEVGFAQASMARIARRAGVSTRTLYKLASGKEELFREAVERRIAAIVSDFGQRSSGPESVEHQLRRLACAFAQLVLSHEACITAKILLAEQGRFPDLAAVYHRNSRRVTDAFDEHAGALLAGRLAPGKDPAVLVRLLRLIIVGQQRQQILGLSPAMSGPEISEFVAQAVAYLLGER
ncbi:TetR family transcriptional regulator [Marinobacterium nitratireducens]|uniref:TetR family transcriptional regulator n=1 Tax=Marinobacterium nitratireducens TaxID=518897 RepID=A0A917ZBH8_9GAMM|nr:TetR/AcrR family transcriptional regulator [Marinobacterium nitratireducens]GGO80300.1 TetR family transcriptional regulator [Marinobacterium nitratireducens]